MKLKIYQLCSSWVDAGSNWIACPCLERLQYISLLFTGFLLAACCYCTSLETRMQSDVHCCTALALAVHCIVFDNWEGEVSEVLPSGSEFWRTMKNGTPSEIQVWIALEIGSIVNNRHHHHDQWWLTTSKTPTWTSLVILRPKWLLLDFDLKT